MDITPSEEQLAVQRTAREAAERLLAPRAADRDRDGTFPEAELRELAKLGLLGVAVPEELGGAGSDPIAYSLAMQELARVDASVAVAVSVTNMVGELIAAVGTDVQRRRWVPGLTSGALLCGAFALSEPQAGSDPAAMTTRAEPIAGGGFRLSGTKQWITSGDRAGVLVVWAMTDPAAGHKGITAFLVPGGAPGLTVARLEDKMGLHGSSTAQLVLDGVEVDADAVLGGIGGGFRLAMMALDGGRIGIASQALGIARGALEAAVRYARERTQFGQPIIQHQAIGNMLADAATWLEAGTLMTLRAADLKAKKRSFTLAASMAKLFATEHAGRVCDIALQVHGGYGYVRDFPIERAYRDVRVTRIYEGTSEIQRLVIARQLIAQGG
ncbi:MAG: acyl-CoA dehydrogenase family protein [Kofleriaceae bacterium]|jgi:alkylation response protein AidB-like acyl-CoA dehydrogenase|nr:acyl-CoA dehydrogenase family protein [Kofleriaceae bacterium]MBP6840473.1 acyl-CoA dehydrogenase family protein [Kofleriaceae bacterium]MBP9205454.1 acyl-CoA dehydrogenase family protein [Kofleriaceae bacterium]